MNHHYKDIRERILGEPAWFDEHAVPRYRTFTPELTADIYADEAALCEIACQDCGRRFLVCFSSSGADRLMREAETGRAVPPLAESMPLHYGDPPNVECCPAGPTMNSVMLRCVEFWRFDLRAVQWQRVPELELVYGEDAGG